MIELAALFASYRSSRRLALTELLTIHQQLDGFAALHDAIRPVLHAQAALSDAQQILEGLLAAARADAPLMTAELATQHLMFVQQAWTELSSNQLRYAERLALFEQRELELRAAVTHPIARQLIGEPSTEMLNAERTATEKEGRYYWQHG